MVSAVLWRPSVSAVVVVASPPARARVVVTRADPPTKRVYKVSEVVPAQPRTAGDGDRPDRPAPTSRSGGRRAAGRAARDAAQARREDPASWEAALEALRGGATAEYQVIRVNRGGAVVDGPGGLEAFVPFNLLDATRMPADAASDESARERCAATLRVDPADPTSGWGTVRARVVRVDVPSRDLILSERAALMAAAVRSVAVGEVRDALVTSVKDFGCFCSLADPVDGEFHGVEGLVHISELSWQRVQTPDAVVKRGDRLRVKVVGVDSARGRISLSVRQLSDDPLRETLEDLLPLGAAEGGADFTGEGKGAAAGAGTGTGAGGAAVAALCAGLQQHPGVAGVALGRRGSNRAAVSQDLEVWLTTRVVADGFNVVARAGGEVQEIHVTTSLDAAGVKRAIADVLAGLPGA